MNSRRWLLLGVGILIVALGAGAFGWATLEADEYERDFDQWVSDERPNLNGSVRVPTQAFGYSYPIGDVEVKSQASGCDEIRAGRPALAATAGKLPRITELPLDRVVPSYGKAVDRDQRRARVVKTFSEAGNRVLKQMERDCAFEGKVLRLDARRDAAFVRSDKLADPPSAPYCDDEDGCIPEDAATRQKFATAQAKAIEHQRAAQALYRTAECRSTSYKTACEDVADAMDRVLKRDEEYVRQVRALTASSTGYAVNQAADQSDRAFKKYERTLRRLLAKQVPGVEDFSDFTDDPTSVDSFLSAVTNLRVRELLDERNAVRGL